MSKNIMDKNSPFSFNISLSVLNHLGRNLYRSFTTVLGEAVSNSWDADANNVWIYVDKEKNNFVIKDDGLGMLEDDFQKKFLKVGYSKREDGRYTESQKRGRPYIGRKGIGKLALLSCSKKVEIISKTATSEYIAGCIDNTALDEAISDDSNKYELGEITQENFELYKKNHSQGTIIFFEEINDGIKNSLEHLKKIIALYFRFSLIDESFNIYLNDEKITEKNLKDLAEKTEFLWNINDTLDDPYVKNELTAKKEGNRHLVKEIDMKGFLATVETPRYLKVMNLEEKVGVDLFVNGRLREKNILRHMPDYSTRYVASYLYGQIHYNDLDGTDNVERFTSSRESIISGDKKYSEFLLKFKEVLEHISNEWDEWRLKHKKEGDPENTSRMPLKERKAKSLVDEVSKEYSPPKGSKNKDKVDRWINDLGPDARFNLSSYTDCFMSENLIRNYTRDRKIKMSEPAKGSCDKWKNAEIESKKKGNISIEVRQNTDDISYLSMNDLAYLVDMKNKGNPEESANLSRDADAYKPMRDAVAHTARLTEVAKNRLNTVYENIKGRLKMLLSDDSEE